MSFKGIFKQVELANGGSDMAFHHYGSHIEYQELLARVRDDPCFHSLAYAGAAVHWLKKKV